MRPGDRHVPGSYRASLTHYVGEAEHPAHAHDHLQCSFVLAGTLEERLGRRAFSAGPGWRGRKPAGAVHSDRWGRHGVLIFTVRLAEDAAVGERSDPGWTRCDGAAAAALVRAFVRARGEAAREEALIDLLALDDGPAVPARTPPPRWLARAREALDEAPLGFDMARLAVEAGVHRAQLSRMFHRHYGMPPSLYRRQALVARASSLLVRDDGTLAAAAGNAGFCDQPHLNRALRGATGLTPRELRGLLHPRHASKTGPRRPDRSLSHDWTSP